jgi:hypothetical protein
MSNVLDTKRKQTAWLEGVREDEEKEKKWIRRSAGGGKGPRGGSEGREVGKAGASSRSPMAIRIASRQRWNESDCFRFDVYPGLGD